MIYRATSTGYAGPWSCWAADRATAEAYTDNPGFGGARIVEAPDPDPDEVLDLVLEQPDGARTDLVRLARVLGARRPEEMALRWAGECGWRYPWEESQEVSDRLCRYARRHGVRWVRYADDYPEGAVVLVRLPS